MASLQQHRDYLDSEWLAAQATPLSSRKAMLVAALIDAYVDRLFDATPGVDDILEFRAGMAAKSAALGLVMALSARRGDVHLVIEAIPVPLAEYGGLTVEDFMVSLYNDHSVQKVRISLPDGGRLDVIETLREAIAALDDV